MAIRFKNQTVPDATPRAPGVVAPRSLRLQRTRSAIRRCFSSSIGNPGISHDLADEIGTGPTETMNLFVARLPEAVEVADADTTRVVSFFGELKRLTPALQNCANNDAVKAAFQRLRQ